jgi:hypothetical protein
MKQDKELVHFHNALWASSLSGLSGTALFWWWEHIDMLDGYSHYRPLSTFLSDLPLTQSQLSQTSPIVTPTEVRAVGLQGDQCAYVWLSDRNATWWKVVAEQQSPRELEGARLQIEGLKPGAYRAQWWDTYQGQIVKEDTVTIRSDQISIEVPRFARDIACKIRP